MYYFVIPLCSLRCNKCFLYLLDEVALEQTRLNKISAQLEKLESFLKQCRTFPNAFLIGGPADILVIELADQVETVLLHYLSQIKFLEGMELRVATRTRLKTYLYSYTSPGGPM
ncbi:uncharacterized protein LOC111289753 isoform X2 [Durio zibethinus]|nr:uncharacterized protein LOC111289753 isoform X2 [Durio zibethinus]XP_022736772.1 uncharacterized protein LOC111289753 isoform X2 [Durio zibethinus]XP_022736773.1 uncharacterized protein LOC111289753 isoform X2 [Durio zibethinus]XP_022736774.1 uncharacterized protein LOC111289753 isoform X2 [Durio zibethinus]XP_022736775.1 uncharacterized protein LOC111289753 isoform X2 [Durio zibethinus]XP_022736776.1 uncharacterized protein LOC111289753 isoform X2 [Durio zibethinus]